LRPKDGASGGESLGAADLYRDEIMKQLAAARAVISIWTPNSIQSDWVRAEAGRAKADGKLIPVKTADVAYADIPLPFGEMHTENIASTDLIRSAVVAQLAKPAAEPSAVALLRKGFRYELLTWFGIVGGALTLFTNLSAVLKLADWARVLVQHWKEWIHAFWVWAFGWLGIHVTPEWVPVLTFLSFGLFLIIGQAFKFSQMSRNQPVVAKHDVKSLQLNSRRALVCLSLIFVSLVPLFVVVVDFLFLNSQVSILLLGDMPMETQLIVLVVSWLVAVIIPQVIIMLFAKHRLHAALSLVLMTIFFNLIIERGQQYTNLPIITVISNSWVVPVMTAYLMAWVLPLILFLVAPAKAVSRRLVFLALGLLLLIALNELSKLGLDVTAPKLQG
jgi:hypothetical protein